MEAEDRHEVREMLTDIMATPLEKINGQNRVMMSQLANIEVQVTKTNGTVKDHTEYLAELKIADIMHIANCPAMPKIDEIKSDLLEYKWFKQHPKIGLGIIAVSVALILFNVFGIFEKKNIANDLILTNKIQTKEYRTLILKIDSLTSKFKEVK